MNRPGSRNRKNKKKITGALAGAGIVALFLALMISFGKTAPENPMGAEEIPILIKFFSIIPLYNQRRTRKYIVHFAKKQQKNSAFLYKLLYIKG